MELVDERLKFGLVGGSGIFFINLGILKDYIKKAEVFTPALPLPIPCLVAALFVSLLFLMN